MISGSITLHTEPVKISYPVTHYNKKYGTLTYNEKQQLLTTILARAEKSGFSLGARVRRKYATASPDAGRVIQIMDKVEQAFSQSSGECEPLKVSWQPDHNITYGFTYSLDELELVPEE